MSDDAEPEVPSEELPPPIRGGSAHRQSAQQRQAAMSAPMVYVASGGAASLRRAMGAVEKLAGDATAEEVVEAIRQEEPGFADAIEPVVSRPPRGWTSHQWAMFLLGLYLAFVATFGSPAHNQVLPDVVSLSGDQIARIGDIVRDVVEGSQPDPDAEDAEDGGGVPKSE